MDNFNESVDFLSTIFKVNIYVDFNTARFWHGDITTSARISKKVEGESKKVEALN